MWPFIPITLYDKYSKLMKLITSIDSHFEVTENEDDSVRLHLPNYKGNQPMDFHIYLMDPFLFISFETEIEGKKISLVNSYPQEMEQQDMFNAVMASNLDRVHQILEEKNENDEDNDETIAEEKNTSSKASKNEKTTYGIVRTWPLLVFAKEHGKMQVGEFKDKNTGEVFKACIFTKPDGTRTFVAFASAMGELTPKEIAEMKDELQVVQLESGNYSLCKIRKDPWADVILDDDNNDENSSCEYEVAPNTCVQKETHLPSTKDEKGKNWLNLNEMKKEVVKPYDSIKTSAEIQERQASTRKSKIVRPPKETKPTSLHYLAVALDMVIAIAVGICVYNSNMIRLEQDRMLFLVACFVLAVVAWGYPYFDTSVKIDNDGCFAQGCIHPIIGVIGVLLFPLFIHYWLYKGIKICIIQFKNYLRRNNISVPLKSGRIKY